MKEVKREEKESKQQQQKTEEVVDTALEKEREVESVGKELEQEVRNLGEMGMFSDNPWVNPEVRKRVLEEMEKLEENEVSVEVFLLNRRVKQKVLLQGPLKLDVEYQTLKAGEDLLVKELMRDAVDQLDMYFGTLQSLYMLAVSLVSINGVEVFGEGVLEKWLSK